MTILGVPNSVAIRTSSTHPAYRSSLTRMLVWDDRLRDTPLVPLAPEGAATPATPQAHREAQKTSCGRRFDVQTPWQDRGVSRLMPKTRRSCLLKQRSTQGSAVLPKHSHSNTLVGCGWRSPVVVDLDILASLLDEVSFGSYLLRLNRHAVPLCPVFRRDVPPAMSYGGPPEGIDMQPAHRLLSVGRFEAQVVRI